MNVQIPQPRLPNVTLPAIGNIPTLPFLGCAGADGTSYVGKKFGNLPDLQKLLHLKSLKHVKEEQVITYIQGKLPDALRPVPYDARAVQITSDVATIVTEITSTVNELTAEINDAIDYVNQQVTAVNQAKAAILAVPEAARSAVQKLMFERYGRYAQELNAQVGRLESTLACITS